jgi:hypothetical protein
VHDELDELGHDELDELEQLDLVELEHFDEDELEHDELDELGQLLCVFVVSVDDLLDVLIPVTDINEQESLSSQL